ncbi:MAG: hypothetical protein IJW59_05395 [Clostridia bacterium]|nr:hypothetical protein [Clostridia bacterium]
MNKFRSYKTTAYGSLSLIACILVVFCFVSLTMAFFFDTDFASSNVSMSGKVVIEAVGEGDTYNSIEDTTTSNLVITLQDNHNVLIPNMEIYAYANCKIYRSLTMPLLRAKLQMNFIDMSDGTIDEQATAVINDMKTQFNDVIVKDKDWYLHTDGYYYYIGDIVQTATEGNEGDYKLKEIDVTSVDEYVVHFIDEPILFPYYVTSDYSGLGFQMVITFQAIQNYIPDASGIRLENTINNAQLIFNNQAPDATV